MRIIANLLFFLILIFINKINAQEYQNERKLRYLPEGNDFVIKNGDRRFNRAIYGTNTAFRVEAGDLPEFALFTGRMAGNFKFGLISGNNSKWLINANEIEARYRPGSMIYKINDPILGEGILNLVVLAMADAEGMIIKANFNNINKDVTLVWAFGGASGKKIRRNGDLNADPDTVFYLIPENCKENVFEITDNSFVLHYGNGEILTKEKEEEILNSNESKRGYKKRFIGAFPFDSELKISDASNLDSPISFFNSENSDAPVLASKIIINTNEPLYFLIQNPDSKHDLSYSNAITIFNLADSVRFELANRIKIETPDPYINLLGGALSIAADAIWEYPTYLHGAIGWRIRLNGWRGPYTADPLGWHDRARDHFSSYALSQVIQPDSGPSVPDPKKNLARQEEKMGNAIFTSGYICRDPNGRMRPHHYDMNLVFIDDLLRHFKWTGDLDYIREMWPVLQRHLAWEKRNFDGDNDGLYDAYCCIWASDALEYMGGGVTHSSAYNYFSNKMAAELAKLIGENSEPYDIEAEKIYNAIQSKLWMPSKGCYAEYIDFMGLKRVHQSAALWTIYHAIDSKVPDPFQSYQATRYIDEEIPHIPVKGNGLSDDGYYVLSTSSWMPYAWSLNNVVMAENLHTALAFWQSGRFNEAFKLWKSSILDAMYLGASPGNFVQLSYLDAARGELYRDFADEVGMTARTLVEGLFGIQPNALNDKLLIKPGLPFEWDSATLITPDILFKYKRTGNKEIYIIDQSLPKLLNLNFEARAIKALVQSVKVNGKDVSWSNVEDIIETPRIFIECGKARHYQVEIEWGGEHPEKCKTLNSYINNEYLVTSFGNANILEIYDPQGTINNSTYNENTLSAIIDGELGHHTLFVKLKQGDLQWWLPLNFEIKDSLEIIPVKEQEKNKLEFIIKNNIPESIIIELEVNPGKYCYKQKIVMNSKQTSEIIDVPYDYILPGRNLIRLNLDRKKVYESCIINWDVDMKDSIEYRTIDLSVYYNEYVTHIFKNEYLSPRPLYPTLQIPKQGIGNWCYTDIEPEIDDSGLRKMAGKENKIKLPQGFHFATPSETEDENIIFTSQWDNYPDEITIPLKGKASHVYFLMAGSTNPMQSRIENGEIEIEYSDGSFDKLELTNPDTWWPIEQDYFTNDYAFKIKDPYPVRVRFKTGLITSDFSDYDTIKGFSNYIIDGGAATVYDLPLNHEKTLKNFHLKTLSNESIIGLMGVTFLE